MKLITIKEYAARKNITYEAVRQQVIRYKQELDGHIIREGRQQFLDEEAVAFLDERRLKNPIAIFHQNKDDAIKQLEEQVKLLLAKIADQADKLSELAEWKSKNALLIASAEQTQRALAASESKIRSLEELANYQTDIAAKETRKAKQAFNEAQELREALQAAEDREKAIREKYIALANRGFWDRVFNKGVR